MPSPPPSPPGYFFQQSSLMHTPDKSPRGKGELAGGASADRTTGVPKSRTRSVAFATSGEGRRSPLPFSSGGAFGYKKKTKRGDKNASQFVISSVDQRDEEMNIVRQGKTETALLSSVNREEVETSIPTVTLVKNEDVRLDDVDEKSILHDILFGRGFPTAGSTAGGATVATDGSSFAPMRKERVYFHNQPAATTTPQPARSAANANNKASSSDRPAPLSASAITNDNHETKLNSSPVAANSENSLHKICEDSRTVPEFLERASATLSTREAGSQDGEGRTPLHCLSLNANLAKATLTREQKQLLERVEEDPTGNRKDGSTSLGIHGKAKQHQRGGSANRAFYPELHSTYSEESTNSLEQDLVDFIITELWRAYRPAMITPDRYGYIPFQETLTDWVKDAHCTHEATSTGLSPSARSSFWTSNFRSRWNVTQSGGSKNGTSPQGSVEAPRSLSPPPTGRSGLMGRVVVQPFPKVRLTAQAIFSFTVLSAMIDRVDQRIMLNGGKPFPRRKPAESMIDDIVVETTTGGGAEGRAGDQQALHVAVHRLRTMTVEDIGSEIVQSIASVPDLVKTVMLIEDSCQREYVLSTLIMRRVLISKYSVGGWLTRMLSSVNKRVSDRGIDYLRIVSDSDLFESNAPKSQGSWRRSKSFSRSSSNLSANESDGNVSKRNVDQEDLYNEISNLQDFVPSLLSLGERDVEDAATTPVVKKVLDQLITRPFAATVILCDALLLVLLIAGLRVATNHLLLGAPKNTVVNYLYIAGTGLFYFIMRELGKAVSLLMVTKRARVYFWSFWNLCDMVSTILAAASLISVRQFCNSGATFVDMSLRNLISVTTGFLWLRVLSYLKGINEQLATFVLCILTIVRDVTWFCIILLTLVVAFAQMFFTILVPAYCADTSVPEQNGECTPSEYYLNAYSLLLGNFGNYNRDDFYTVFSVFLAVFFTFVVTLVLLNVLIAVANDSYEKCLLRSENLFGRARVMLIAELVSFQNLLRRNADESRAPRRVYNAWWSSGINGWSRGSLMYFALTILIVILWVTYDITAIFYGKGYGNILLGLGSILINLLIFIGIMILLSTGAIDIARRTKNSKITSSEDEPRTHRFCGDRYGNFLQSIVMRLLGSSTSTTAAESYHADSWHGRLVYLQNEMVRIADESNEETTLKLQALERVIQQTDTRFHGELTSLELSISELQADLRKTLAALRK